MRIMRRHFLRRWLLLLGVLGAFPGAVALAEQEVVAAENEAGDIEVAPAPEPVAQGGLDPNNLPAEMDMSLDELLNDPEGLTPNVDATRCLMRVTRYNTVILDSAHLLFKSSTGRRAWLNRLSSECIGLRPSMILIFESTSSRRCALDSVQGVENGIGSFPSARCRLGKFEPITFEHAEALEETFKKSSQALAEARRQERKVKRETRKRKKRAAREARRQERAAAG